MEQITEPKKVFCFKDYYADNADFRKKHIEYMSQHIECTCG